MTLEVGIVCSVCDWLNELDRATCKDCGGDLALFNEDLSAARQKSVKANGASSLTAEKEPGTPKKTKQEVEEKPMEQARHYVCQSCYSPVPSGHKFCGKCGTAAENPAGDEPEFFGDMQVPGKAKLILIKGEGMDGISYHLNSTEHIAGRVEGAILFTEDKWLSPKHANFFYDDEGNLRVRDEESINGVFICVRDKAPVSEGSLFLAGEQLFRIEFVEDYDDDPEADGTYYFASPRREPSFRVIQILEGGGEGMIVHARDGRIEIGREGGDMNFPNDPYISGRHVRLELEGSTLQLSDLNSKNGTYLKTLEERILAHGDYLFLGKQLLRVEITN
jgi:hypothetical protein